ncbi:hypothetical protein BGZ83_007917 [Gryganskiella cystojenkinii]|nr:hypothetical protein BGZ83_007917 [Gryganskiella cystojenkinii]
MGLLAESEAAEKQAKGERTTHDRSSYWLAQARFLVGTIMEGTEYEPKHETVRTRESGGYSGNSNNSNMVRIYHITDDVTPPLHDYAPNLQQQQEGEGEELNLAADTGGSNTSQQQDPIDDGGNTSIATNSNTPSITLVTGPLPPSTTSQVTHALDLPPSAVSPFPSTTQAGVAISEAASTVGLNAEGKFKGPSPGSLPEERLLAMVDLLFDPNLVDLYHRRAVINCARYVSAKIDDIFMRAFQITDPYNPDFHALFQDRCHVQTGPYLTMYAPVLYDDDGLELTAQEQALIGRASSKSIAPPRKLSNFQMLLWHRCLSDLIKLYHRIQDRHLPEGPKQPSHHRRKSKRLSSLSSSLSSSSSPVCCQEPPRRRSSHLDDATPEPCRKSYPMCCHAHSLVFSTEYSSFSLVPYPVRVHFRRIVNRVQSASQRTLWSVSNLGRSQGLLTRRVIEYTGPKERLRFCSGSVHPPNYNIVSSSSASECENGGGQLRKQQQDTESLIQQRLRVEESIRQDTLMKQELLALCHMACGLFLTEERNLDTPPTIMSLLRQGGPWNKGIWREGEWRRSAIDPSVTSASTSLSSISSKVKGKKYTMTSNSSDDNNEYAMDQGRWQKICLATIQFLAHEDLAWGGNRTNAELSRLRTTNNATAWVYHE